MDNKDIVFNAIDDGRIIAFLQGQARILEHVLSKKTLQQTLSAISEEFEKYLNIGYCSICLLDQDTNTLKLTAAPNIPQGYQKIVEKVKVTPNSGSCGTAAYRKELVIVSDIQNSPLWDHYKDIAKQYNFAACWSKPIMSSDNHRVLGTFTIYYSTIRKPESHIIKIMEAFSYMAGIAIENYLKDRQLENSQEQYRLITENMSDFISIVHSTGEIEYASPSHEKTFGFIPSSLEEFTQLVHQEDLPIIQHAFEQIREGVKKTRCEFRIKKSNRNWIYLEMNLKPFKTENIHNGKLLCVCRQITEQKKYENRLKQMAFYDALTGLPNRSFFIEQLKEEILLARENSESFAILYLDCDDFKQINDALGHDAGDSFLREFVKRTQESIFVERTFARMGGDEFTILISNIESEDQVAKIAKQILSALEQPWHIDHQEFILSVSMGISIFPRDGLTANSLIKHADYSMYFAKKHGKNQFQFYNPKLHRRNYNQTKLKKDLYLAIERNELYIHYQPIVNMDTGTIEGTEALIRWNHPQYGVVPPSEFISLAEETGLIIQIGEWVLTKACHQLKKWHESGYNTLKMSVNLSPIQIEQYHFAENILKLLHDLELQPEFISLEITESIFIKETTNTKDTLDLLKSNKIGISFDDFGTGYSSLSYLKDFPVNIIKIDRAFVRDLALSKHDAAIVDTILKICTTLRLGTIAEGVETADHALKLKELGCTLLQGYYFSKPCSPEELEERFPVILQKLSDLNKKSTLQHNRALF